MSVWPDVEIKSTPNFSKKCPKSSQSSFKLEVMLFKKAQIVFKHLDYFFGIILSPRNFQKSPNLVTLDDALIQLFFGVNNKQNTQKGIHRWVTD